MFQLLITHSVIIHSNVVQNIQTNPPKVDQPQTIKIPPKKQKTKQRKSGKKNRWRERVSETYLWLRLFINFTNEVSDLAFISEQH